MNVTLIAASVLTDGIHQTPYRLGDGTSMDELAEASGRNCYQSWNRPNPETASNAGYLKNIIQSGHLSVLEHASATFFVEDVSTALLGQLTRHRHLSFSVESARYVDKTGNDVIIPHVIDGDADLYDTFNFIVDETMKAYEDIATRLEEKGHSRKEARQAARFILPQGISTTIVVTGNLRAWREVIGKRYTKHADVEIRSLAREILIQLKSIAPNSFQDFEVKD